MSRAINVAGGPVTREDVLAIHRTLMQADLREGPEAGKVRSVQNWIGGSDYSPRGAIFVPPGPRHLDAGLGDLVDFCNRRDLSPVTLAAVAHAQFETLHPFVDGNGRTGRLSSTCCGGELGSHRASSFPYRRSCWSMSTRISRDSTSTGRAM